MKLSKYLLALFFSSAASANVSAMADGFYAGVSVGIDHSDFSVQKEVEKLAQTKANIGVIGTTQVSDQKNSEGGFGLSIGYKFGLTSIEGSFSSLRGGEITTSVENGTINGNPLIILTRVSELEIRAFSLSALRHLKLSRDHSLFGKIGFSTWKFITTSDEEYIALTALNQVEFVTLPSTENIERGSSSLFGIGWEYDQAGLLLRIAFDRYLDVGNSDTSEGDITRIKFSLNFIF